MVNMLEARDKSGRLISLSRERLRHILAHPEMTNQVEQITETLLKPDTIIPFEYDPAVHFYFTYFKERRKYLFVSVKYLNGTGFIITAYYTDKIR